MNIKYMVTSAIIRRVVYIVIAAALAWAGMGRAEAATQQQAWQACWAYVNNTEFVPATATNRTCDNPYNEPLEGAYPNQQGRLFGRYMLNGSGPYGAGTYNWGGNSCPQAQGFDYVTGQCAVDCSSQPDQLNKSAKGIGGTFCSGGCTFAPLLGDPKYRVIGTGADRVMAAGTWAPTGSTCTAGPSNEPKPYDPDKSICQSTGAGFSECIKPNGDHCVTGAQGTRMCWSPGQEGPRLTTEGTEGSDRAIPPKVPAPPPGQTNPTPTTTTTTTIGPTTYTTTIFSGTGQRGGQPDTGPGGSGTGQGTDGEGEEGEGEEGSASGGETCGAPPACSGDAILCAINAQTWRNRCAEGDSTGGAPGDMGEEGDPDSIISDEEPTGEDGLDTSGFGWARSCPEPVSVTVFSTTVEFDTAGVLCNWLQLGGVLVLLFSAYGCLRLMGGAV